MIDVVIGELADQLREGVVCVVRSDGAPMTVGARDLLAGAGERVTDRVDRMGPLPLGGAFVTQGGELPTSYLIHTVTASVEEPETLHSVQNALRNALRRAADLGMESLALPPLGLGVGQLEAEDAARSVVEILVEHLADDAPPRELTVVVASPYEHDIFEHLVERLGRGGAPPRN